MEHSNEASPRSFTVESSSDSVPWFRDCWPLPVGSALIVTLCRKLVRYDLKVELAPSAALPLVLCGKVWRTGLTLETNVQTVRPALTVLSRLQGMVG